MKGFSALIPLSQAYLARHNIGLYPHEKCETTLHYYVQLSPEQVEQTWKETTPYAHRL